MSLFIASLNSGSNGNCYYIGNQNAAVLVDAGISCRETERRMKWLNLRMELVKAIFISHEHSDHITGLPALSKKYQLPVYITPATFKAANIPVEEHLLQGFTAHQPVSIADLQVTAFPKFHDAADPHSFIIKYTDTTVGVFTDIGHACPAVVDYFSRCNAAFLEANYCPTLLRNSRYPFFLQQRISGNEGHLSNEQALELFRTHKGSELQQLILSHLSKNNNNPVLVEQIFAPHTHGVQMTVASRYEASPVYEISTAGALQRNSRQQLTLF